VIARPASAADAAAVATILAREVVDGVAHFGSTPPTTAEITQDITTAGRHPFLVAEQDGVVLGFAKASPWKAREAYAWTAELGVYLAPSAQGRGVGRTLVVALIAELESRGFRTLLAGIALPNPASVRLFESLGFETVGVMRNNGFKHGRWHDVGYWSKHLGSGPPS
jgi:L-amino acid N-acyltransferase YncA